MLGVGLIGISNTIVQANSSSNQFAETVLVEWIENKRKTFISCELLMQSYNAHRNRNRNRYRKSVIFWRYTPKPEFQKKLTEIFKNYLIRF